jgi:histidine kinase/DNA gyrase B/HSP90-like ATPase
MRADNKVVLKLGGIDPSILRELSGGYKPFVKAFKELVCNAFDADADLAEICLAENCCQIEVRDNGLGMTPLEFQKDFAKLGGSQKGAMGLTSKGRPRIGSKGIGFLAVARYCSAMEVRSTSIRKHEGRVVCRSKGKIIDLCSALNLPIQRSLFSGRLKVTSLVVTSGSERVRWQAKDFELDDGGRLHLRRRLRDSRSQIEVKYVLDCSSLEFKATFDYDYLLALENKKDLTEVADFCKLEVHSLEKNDPRTGQHYTEIKLTGLKDFVVRELRAQRRPGRVRNIDSHSGVERFLWHLRRCTPVVYELPASIQQRFGEGNLKSTEIKSIDRVSFAGPGFNEFEITRPLWAADNSSDSSGADAIAVPVDIDREGLTVRGYLWGHTEAIFPAEYRGIAVRVRNVQIGEPGFLGLEEKLSGPSRAILSQITGEINIVRGLDDVDALNPGRDSFYEENPHYKLLKNHIAGDGETLNGLLAEVINRIVSRTQVLAVVQNHIARANQHRSTLINLSVAINHYGMNGGRTLRQFFSDESHRANGLSERRDAEKLPRPRLAGFRVKSVQDPEPDQFIDFANKIIHLNSKHDRWNDQIFVLGGHYRVVPKVGSEDDPLCEIDTGVKKIYVNWGHPLRQQMGDAAFLKSAVAWKLAHHACDGDIEAMMELALKILTFNGA